MDAVLGVGGDVPDAEYVDHKLSGNQVANFARVPERALAAPPTGRWGRLDAARSLVEMVRAGSPDALIDPPALEAMFVDVAPGTQWAELLRRRWDSFTTNAGRHRRVRSRSSPSGCSGRSSSRRRPYWASSRRVANGEDLPPTDADLRGGTRRTERIATAPIPTGPVAAAAKTAAGDGTGDGGDTAYLQPTAAHLGAIGSESVAGLLRTASAAPVAAAPRPGGLAGGPTRRRRVRARAVRWGLFAPAKPLVLLPLVLGVTAPLTTLASGLVTWFGDRDLVGRLVLAAGGRGRRGRDRPRVPYGTAWQYTRIRLLPLVVAVASTASRRWWSGSSATSTCP